MIDFPGSKINLGLYITGKRPDGYHNLETVFFPTSWSDVLEIIPSDTLQLDITGLSVAGNPDDNLCVKAWRMLHQDFGIPSVHIHLHKVVPMGAGLGGGSADGASMLKLLNTLFELNLSVAALKNYAQQLGSDCSFFIEKKPVFAYGRGELMQPLAISLSGFTLLVIYPGIESSTSTAYRGISASPATFDLKTLPQLPVSQWRFRLKNQFTHSVAAQIPVIQELIQGLYDQGAVYAEMSGSGSAVFALFQGDKANLDLTMLSANYATHVEVLA